MQHLLIRRIGARKFILEEEFKSECGITVPIGTFCDGLSIPFIFRWISFPTGLGFNASVVHDYLLQEGHSWEDANERFAAQLEADAVPSWKIKLYMFGVRSWAKLKG